MENLLMEGRPLVLFKIGAIRKGTEYDIEVNGHKRTYRTHASEFRVPQKEWERPTIFLSNELLPSNGNPYTDSYSHKYNEDFVEGVYESVSITAKHIMSGAVKIKESGTNEWLTPDELLVVKTRKEFNPDKIKGGQLWSLTVDGDDRFQNTTIMILELGFNCIRFQYQTKVKHSDDFSTIESAEGVIDLYTRDGELQDISKIHLTLINDNTNPNGSIMDRSEPSKYVYPRAFGIGFRSDIPERELRERKPIKLDEDDDYSCEE